jgi:hypothetical protein
VETAWRLKLTTRPVAAAPDDEGRMIEFSLDHRLFGPPGEPAALKGKTAADRRGRLIIRIDLSCSAPNF